VQTLQYVSRLVLSTMPHAHWNCKLQKWALAPIGRKNKEEKRAFSAFMRFACSDTGL